MDFFKGGCMPFDKHKKEKEFKKEVAEHAVAIMEAGATRETAINETKIKYDLSLEDLEKIVPRTETKIVPKKTEGRIIGKADGTKVLVTT